MNKEKVKNFSRVLTAIRESNKLSQRQLSEIIGVDPSYLSRIEKGERMPSDDIIMRLADALNAPELFTAAGIHVPSEFEQKNSKKIVFDPMEFLKQFDETNLPEPLDKLILVHNNKAQFNYLKKFDFYNSLTLIENGIAYLYNDFRDIENEIRNICYDHNKILLDKLFETVNNLIKAYQNKEKIKDELNNIMIIESDSSFYKKGIFNTWEAIQEQVNQDLPSFLTQFIYLETDVAKTVADLIQLQQKKSLNKSKFEPKND